MWYKLIPKLRTNKTSAGIAFLKGSLANTIRVNAAASIVPANNNPAHKAITGIQIPINIPIAPTISKAPVKKLKNEGKPNRLNSSAIFPDIIFVPVIKKNRDNTTFTILMKIKIVITPLLLFGKNSVLFR